MFSRNVNFDAGIINGRKGIVRAISPRIVDVQVIAPGDPLVKVPRITFEDQVGSKGITFHRQQFLLRVCYAVTINKSQGRTPTKVRLDLRVDVFCHGQLYVALSRTTSSSNILCLVPPELMVFLMSQKVFTIRSSTQRRVTAFLRLAPFSNALPQTTYLGVNLLWAFQMDLNLPVPLLTRLATVPVSYVLSPDVYSTIRNIPKPGIKLCPIFPKTMTPSCCIS